MRSEAQRVMRPRQVAEKFGVGVAKVHGWIKSGELLAVDVSTKGDGSDPQWAISPEQLQAFEKRRSNIEILQNKQRGGRRRAKPREQKPVVEFF